MENYQKRPKSKRSRFEADNDDASTALQPSEGKPGAPTAGQPRGKGTPSSSGGGGKSDANTPRHGVMHISAHGKIRTYVSRGLEVLLESEQQSNAASTSSTSSSSTVVLSSSSSSQGPATTNDDDHDDASSPKGTNEKHKRNYSGAAGVLTIKAQGKNIPKAVTIVEILKRKLEGSLHQFTEIGQVTEEEVWDPKTTTLTSAPAAAAGGPAIASSSSAGSKQQQQQQQLDPIRLVRHRPTIRIRLSRQLDIHRPPQADEESDGDEEAKEMMEAWPGAILDRDAAVRRLVGYQAPTGNDIYL
ncbi:hypothetical protein DFQ26_007154 [Actinomortierella ambigua]|nr:hypothetical protein DFQ26_007154 [Actinomortierella ambigua]